MKTRLWIYGFILVLAVLAVLLLQRQAQRMENLRPLQESIQVLSTSVNRSITVQTDRRLIPPATPLPANLVQRSLNDRQKPPELFRQYVEDKNSNINFYGQVIDQYSNGIPGVHVKVKLRQWYVSPPSTFNAEGRMIPIEKETSSDGRFEIHGERGDNFDLDYIQKDGYELSSKTYPSYKTSGGSPDNPVIFKMWEKGTKEALIAFRKDTRIPYNGTSVIFDLLKGEKSLTAIEGDLRVTLLRNPLKVQFDRKTPYDWDATIEAIGGGVIETDDEFMYRAPETGYQPKLEIDMPATATNWTSLKSLSFYLKSRGGQCYGRVTVGFYTDSPKTTTGFRIDSVLNPSGSRNLE